jgi:hypothetical protein
MDPWHGPVQNSELRHRRHCRPCTAYRRRRARAALAPSLTLAPQQIGPILFDAVSEWHLQATTAIFSWGRHLRARISWRLNRLGACSSSWYNYYMLSCLTLYVSYWNAAISHSTLTSPRTSWQTRLLQICVFHHTVNVYQPTQHGCRAMSKYEVLILSSETIKAEILCYAKCWQR